MVPDVELKVSRRSQGDHAVMSVEGELDLYTAPRLHTELTAALSGDNIPSCLVVDMSGVGFCDSTGMRSEEHTSELQSRRDLVCRLLLEEKNRIYWNNCYDDWMRFLIM